MTATYLNICTDSELEAKAQSVLTDLGLDMTTAINGFLTQVVREKSVPFDLDKPKTPNGKRPRSEFLGCMEGKIWMSDDFDAPLEDMREYME
jgi:addiction module RelB/DinJ family antitoxin